MYVCQGRMNEHLFKFQVVLTSHIFEKDLMYSACFSIKSC